MKKFSLVLLLILIVIGPIIVPNSHVKAAAGGYGTVNLAKNKPITPLTNTVRGKPGDVNDGNVDSVWYSFNSNYGGNSNANSFVLDLGSVYNIGRIDIFPAQVHGFTISTSDDNSTWTERYKSPWVNTSVNAPISVTPDGAFSARYIKYWGYANWSQYVGVIEINVYEWLASPSSPPSGANGSTNLALNKTVTNLLGPVIQSNPPAYAVDGNPATSWASSQSGRDDGTGKWQNYGQIKIDLGAKYTIGKVVISPQRVHDFRMVMAETDPSPAGSPWVFMSYPELFGAAKTSGDPYTFSLNGSVTARYIWLTTGIWGTPSSLQPAIAEIEVYEWLTGADSSATPAPGGVSGCAQPPAGLVSSWPGDGNANDTQGVSNGVLQGSLGFGAGKVGQGFSFTTGGQAVKIAPAASLTLRDSITLEAWVYPVSPAQVGPIVEYDTVGEGFQDTLGTHLWLWPTPDTLYANLIDTGGNFHIIQASGIVAAGQFQHVALTYSRSSGVASLYRNGKSVQQQNLGNFALATNGALNIGWRDAPAPPSGTSFRGFIDEVAVYSRALSEGEIQAIYAAGSAGKCKVASPTSSPTTPPSASAQAGLVGYWNFSDGSGSVARDSSGNGNDGAVSGAKWVDNAASGKGLSFDGDTDSVKLPHTAMNGLDDFTFSAWIKTSVPKTASIINGANSVTDNEFRVSQGGASLDIAVKRQSFSGRKAINDGSWHFIAVVRKGNTGEVIAYVDGQQDASNVLIKGKLAVEPNGLWIGRKQECVGGCFYSDFDFQGYIDEVRIYSRALSLADIQNDMNQANPPKMEPGAATIAPSTPATAATWRDDFTSSTPGSGWYWVREDPTHWSLTARPGYLRITTQRGDIYERTNDAKNLLLRPAPAGDFEVTTRVSINPTANYQQAQLLIFQDDDNHFRLNRAYDNAQKVEFVKEERGSPTVNSVASNLTTIYLKIAKEGTTYTSYWSADGSSWTRVYQYTNVNFTNLKIGLNALNSVSTAADIPADFDYFTVAAVGTTATPAPAPAGDPIPAPKATDASLMAEERTISPNGKITVPIRLDKASRLGSLNFSLRYDPSVLKVNKAESGDLAGGTLFQANIRDAGIIRFGVVAQGTAGITGDGPVAHVEFTALGARGSQSQLTLGDLMATDTSGAKLGVTLRSGRVTIAAKLKGDYDGDGKVTAKDSLAALKMSVAELPEDLNLDMDGDGKVTAEDARRILAGALGSPVATSSQPAQSSQPTTSSPAPTGGAGAVPAAVQVLDTITRDVDSKGGSLSLKDGITVIIPAGTVDAATKLTINKLDPDNPGPGISRHQFQGFGALATYEVTMGNMSEFKTPLTIEIAYDPAKIASDYPPEKIMLGAWWDPDQKVWHNIPVQVDTQRKVIVISTRHLTIWTALWLVRGYKIRETDHFIVVYDPKVLPKFGVETDLRVRGTDPQRTELIGKEQEPEAFAQRVGLYMEQAYKKYIDKGFRDPRLTVTHTIEAVSVPTTVIPGTSIPVLAPPELKIFVIIQKVDESFTATWFGNIHMKTEYLDDDEVKNETAHELFHTVQQTYYWWRGVGSGYTREQWFMEATADYVADGIAWQGLNSKNKVRKNYFNLPLATVDGKNHEYETAHFIDYLTGKGVDFKAMWDEVVKTDAQIITLLEIYSEKKTGATLHDHYRGFAAHVLFNASGPLEKLDGNLFDSGIPEGPPVLRASDDEVSYKFSLNSDYTAKLWGFKVEPKDTKAARSLKIEVPGTMRPKDKVSVGVYVLKNDQRPQGGVVPKDVIFTGHQTIDLKSIDKDDVVYILAVNTGSIDQSLTVNVTDELTISPPTASVDPGKNVTFTTPGVTEKVLWSVQEGANGGTISAAGVYTAPDKAGIYHVVATLDSDRTKTGTAAVTVAQSKWVFTGRTQNVPAVNNERSGATIGGTTANVWVVTGGPGTGELAQSSKWTCSWPEPPGELVPGQPWNGTLKVENAGSNMASLYFDVSGSLSVRGSWPSPFNEAYVSASMSDKPSVSQSFSLALQQGPNVVSLKGQKVTITVSCLARLADGRYPAMAKGSVSSVVYTYEERP